MRTTGNTILITGGGSGIGRALAAAFHARGNQVIVAGRRQAALDEVASAHPGMRAVVLDVGDAGAIARVAQHLRSEHPALNAVIHSAGIMRAESIPCGALGDAEATVATNLLGPIRLTAALLPLLQAQPHATIMTVSSGLAFVPLANAPTYGATKAAIHSYTQSLRYQLRDTSVDVLELIPPYVQTELMGPGQAHDPAAMPLAEFVAETMHIIETAPGATEICVERVKPLRFAEASGGYQAFYTRFNDAVAAGSQ